MSENYDLLCSETGGDPKPLTAWANLVDENANRTVSLRYLPDSNFYENLDDRYIGPTN